MWHYLGTLVVASAELIWAVVEGCAVVAWLVMGFVFLRSKDTQTDQLMRAKQGRAVIWVGCFVILIGVRFITHTYG
jgi:uncharacterized membrane protein SirB2